MSSPPSGPPSSGPSPPPTPTLTPGSSSSSSSSSSTSAGSSTSSLSSTSDSQSTSSSSSLSSSSTSTSSPSNIPPRPSFTPSDSKSTFISTSDGNPVTVTTVVRTTPSSTGVVKANGSKGFFDNTGAVAGTFSVVGLVGLGILIFVITTVIRRRRAEKFDEDVALAAAEAAATAHNPDFDDYGYSSSGHGVGSYGYADTYHQDPVKFPPTREAYGMSDIGASAYADTDNYTVGTSGGPGAAGIGAGVLYRSKSGKNQPDPYHAYAAHHDPTLPQQQANLRYRNPAMGQREEPSLVGGGYDLARKISQPLSDGGVGRKKSIQSTNQDPSLSSHYSTDPLTQGPYAEPPSMPSMPESYLDHYRAGIDPESRQIQTRPLSMASATDAYGGVIPGNSFAQQPPVPQQPGNTDEFLNPFENRTGSDRRLSDSSHYSDGSHPGFANDDARMSFRDDEDYGAGRRVLKVANE